VSRVIYRVGYATLTAATLCGLLACATSPRRTEAQRQADKETADRVEGALQADRMLYAKHISVRADRGVIRLTGFVWDPPDLDEATRIAEGVEGVTSVINNLELNRNGIDDSTVTR
jgi:hyperosmotically inducible periplasmic protein